MEARIDQLSLAGHRVLVIDETASTNALALERAARGELRPGDAVIATRQSAGRGRRGRTWITVPGRSLALSVLVEAPALPRPAALGLLVAVAVCRALERRGAVDLRIKWPNDIMRGEAKVGGLLVEQAPGARAFVLGIGLNLALRPGDLPADLPGTVGDVALPSDEDARRGHVTALLQELDRALEDGDAPEAPWRDEYRARAWLPGRRAELRHGGRILSGVIEDVSPDGDLLLVDGTRLLGEHVELLHVHRAEDPRSAH